MTQADANQPQGLDQEAVDLNEITDPNLSDKGAVATFINENFDEKTAAELIQAEH